ncbi:pyridoxamine 5'-phosphate oxidase family protein [Actinomycetospora cinnamomea]|uniref:pyridoxamine 5'-phosphate oxidase family protein n=1 Tax=Actinomycetospora cinnamomea TaxID=663609 RepID=UPI001401DEEF|nr:pyridoxamine 5'-phosphate oxidase family protein [Actinomycetospora cinnamomea]
MELAATLAAAVPVGASAYLLTVAPDGRPHATPTTAVVRGASSVVVSGLGRRTRANVEAGSTVAVLWSPPDSDDHTLIVDGTAVVHDDTLVVRPTRAVLHRQAPERPAAAGPVADGACTADCVEIALA